MSAMSNQVRRCRMQVAMAIAGILASGGATRAAGSAGEKSELDEVLVTAERRETDVQKIPASVAAFSGETLQERGITNLETLQGGQGHG